MFIKKRLIELFQLLKCSYLAPRSDVMFDSRNEFNVSTALNILFI